MKFFAAGEDLCLDGEARVHLRGLSAPANWRITLLRSRQPASERKSLVKCRNVDVLVVGSGPTGLVLAIDLVRRGLTVRIIEKAEATFDGSRAKGLQPRTLEIFDGLDVLEDVLAGGSPYPKLGIHFGPLTIPWRMMSEQTSSASTPLPNTWLVPQSRTVSALHARLASIGGCVEFGKELVSFEQSAARITARVAHAEGIEEIAARYLVGADGGSSLVRKQLSIGFVGSTDEGDRIVIVDAVVTGLDRNHWHIWPGRRGMFIGACPLPHSDQFQWMVRLAPGDSVPSDLEAINRWIQSRIKDSRVKLQEITWRSVYRPNTRLAEEYRRGRAFLAGDAAHVHPPAGAQGLNTGIQDAYNLGWKLAQVLHGADARLLDTYEAERRPVAAAVLGLSTQKFAAIGGLKLSSIQRGRGEQQLLLTYRGGPLAALGCGRTKKVWTGDRAPDAELVGTDHVQIRLFDLLRGPDFTVIGYGARAGQYIERLEWPAKGARLRRVVVNGIAARADAVVTDDRMTFRDAYGISGDLAVLIRPDGYVGQIVHAEAFSTQRLVPQMTPSHNAEDVQLGGVR